MVKNCSPSFRAFYMNWVVLSVVPCGTQKRSWFREEEQVTLNGIQKNRSKEKDFGINYSSMGGKRGYV